MLAETARLGSRWRHTFDRALREKPYYDPSVAGYVLARHLVREDGKEVRFVPFENGYRADADEGGTLSVRDDGATYVSAEGVTESYGIDGRLLSRTDANGQALTLHYSEGLLQEVVDPKGRSLRFDYDAFGRLENLTLPDGGTVSYSYEDDTSGRNANLSVVRAPDGRTTRYHYDENPQTLEANHYLTGIDGGDGKRYATFEYSVGEVERVRHGDRLESVRAKRLSQGLLSVDMGSFGVNAWTVVKNGAERISRISDALSSTRTTFEYNEEGQVTRTETPNGLITTYAYDPARHLEVRRTEAVGTPHERTILTGWHPSLRLPTRIDHPAYTALYHYDDRGNLLESETIGAADAGESGGEAWPGRRVMRYTYDNSGRLASMDGPREDVDDTTHFEYYPSDEAGCATPEATCRWRRGDLKTTTNALGHTMDVLDYDGAGRRLEEKDANGIHVIHEYDPAGRELSQGITAPFGESAVTKVDYDANGLPSVVTDADGVVQTYGYDAAHRLISLTAVDGTSHTFGYDEDGNVSKEAYLASGGKPERKIERFFTTKGELSGIGLSNGKFWGYEWRHGLLREVSFFYLGAVEEREYDVLGRHIQSRFNYGNDVVDRTYDYLDSLRTVTDPKRLSTGYLRNGLGDALWQSSPDTGETRFTPQADGLNLATVKASQRRDDRRFDALGRLVERIDSSDQKDTYVYDTAADICPVSERYAIGELSEVHDSSGSTVYCYDFLGRVTTKLQRVGQLALTTQRSFTPASRLASVTLPDGSRATYRYGATGLVNRIDVEPAGGGKRDVAEIRWTAEGRLTHWVAGFRRLDRTYSLDGWPTSITASGADGFSARFNLSDRGWISGFEGDTGVPRYVYDYMDRMTRGKGSYEYDASGNRTEDSSSSYTYEPDSHRLIRVGRKAREYDADGNTTRIDKREFVYDARGRIIQVKVNGVAEMNYRYNAMGERVEQSVAGHTVVTLYDDAGHWQGDYAADGTPLQQMIWLGDWPVMMLAGDKAYDVQSDHLGTPRALVDRDTDTVVWTWPITGDPFGKDKPNEDPDGDGRRMVFNLRFPGQIYDAVSGLHHNYQRDYDPESGRFIQSDPIGLAGGINTYVYANNNPLNFIDPTGYAATDAPGPVESLVPVWGSGRQAVNDWSEGRYLSAAFNVGMAVTDVVPAKMLAGAICKGVAKAGVGTLRIARFADRAKDVFTVDKSMYSATKMHRNKYYGRFYKMKEDGLWWTKDRTAHGGAAWKVYREESNGYRWIKDVDQYGSDMSGKHKGPTNLFIPKDDLN